MIMNLYLCVQANVYVGCMIIYRHIYLYVGLRVCVCVCVCKRACVYIWISIFE